MCPPSLQSLLLTLNINFLIYFCHQHSFVVLLRQTIEYTMQMSINNCQIKSYNLTMNNHDSKQLLNHTRKLGNKQFASYLKSMPRISTLIYNIQKYLSSYDPFYYNAFLASIKGKNLDQLQVQLSRQYNKLIEGHSFLHKINNAVFSREKCLQKIKRDLNKVEAVLTMFKKCYFRKEKQDSNVYIEYTRQQGYTTVQIDQTIQNSIKLVSSLFVDMGRLRDMTIYIVQTVHRWRVQIQEWMDKCQSHARIDYYLQVEGVDGFHSIRLYDKLQEDTDFLWASRLSQYIWLQFPKDPLLIRNVVNVSERQNKEILQKYFIQYLYPKTEEIIDKTVKVIDMFSHVYKPRQMNLHEEEEKLIQNYLSLQRKNNLQIGLQQNNGYDDAQAIKLLNNSSTKNMGSRMRKVQSYEDITIKQQLRNQIQRNNQTWGINSSISSPYENRSPNKTNSRGWVFGKQLRKPATDRIRQIVKKHQNQMNYLKNHKGMIKTFNIVNEGEKKFIAMAYSNQKNQQQNKYNQFKNTQDQKRIKHKNKGMRQYQSNDQSGEVRLEANTNKNLEHSRKKLYQSLVKINSIIEEDPNQHDHDYATPKNKNTNANLKLVQTDSQRLQKFRNKFNMSTKDKYQKEKTLKTQQQRDPLKAVLKSDQKNKTNTAKRSVKHGIKVNSIFKNDTEQQLNAQIQVDEQESPLNFKQFFQVFRADTKDKPQGQSRISNQLRKSNLKKQEVKQLQGSIQVRKYIDRKRAESLKHPLMSIYSRQNKNKLLRQKNKKKLQKSKSKSHSENSFKSYNKVAIKKQELTQQKSVVKKQQQMTNIIQDRQFVNLKSKQITKDTINKYIIHICGQIPISCRSFTNYHTQAYQHKMIELLNDSTVNSLIFDLQGQKDGKIGQAIAIQSLSSTLKMRYSIEFVNVQKFQLLSNCVCKISEQLLATSPCEQVVFKCIQDKSDPVSIHFIALIDKMLKAKAQKFSYFHILQKSLLGLTHQKLFQRLYIFQIKNKNSIKEQIKKAYKQGWRKRVAGSSYRSLVIQTKCLALTSNFKMRSQGLTKPMIQIYRQEGVGILYAMLFQKIITTFHLKQLKIASLSVNDSDQTTGLVKKSPFVRSIINQLLQMIRNSVDPQKKQQLPDWIKGSITKFNNMTDLLNYLSYKQYDSLFKFQFLVESRFILNHQLILSEINLNVSLDFVIQNSVSMLLINNHHNYAIQVLNRSAKSSSHFSQDSGTPVYILPSTEDNLKVFFAPAREYLACSDSLDLYSYIQLQFKQSSPQQKRDVSQIVIPDLTQRKTKVNDVRMYDGFLRLFPQRQFYSSSMFQIKNLWQNFYPNAVISMPSQNAIVIDYPIIVGFYDSILKIPIVSYYFKQQK